MAFLELKDIHKSFGGLKALSGLNVQVNEGEIIGLIGPNGSGKTTSFNIITGFIKPDSGLTLFQGEDITNWSPHLIAKKGIVRTFQLTSLFLELSVLENVVIALNQHSKLGVLHSLLNTPKNRKERERVFSEARDILALTELGSQESKKAMNLSAGWRKTLAIAIALAAKPKLLLLDEPVCTLSPGRVVSIMALIEMLKKNGITVLLIEHNMRAIMDYCDRIVVLSFGRKLAEGAPLEVQSNRAVIDAYLGA